MVTLLFKNFSYADENKVDSKKITRTVAYTLPVYHLNRLPLNEFISTNAFNMFLDTLDPSKSYFLKEDIDTLSSTYPSLHRDLRKGDISFSKEAYEILMKRMKDRYDYTKSLLENEFNTNVDESYLWDRKESSWVEDKNEWDELWRKKINVPQKYQSIFLPEESVWNKCWSLPILSSERKKDFAIRWNNS